MDLGSHSPDAADEPRRRLSANDPLLLCLRDVGEVAPEMRLNQLSMFLMIAASEGVLMGDLARRCGESLSTVSRGVRRLASPGDPGALHPAYGLVELLSDADDRRARHIVLTERGRALADRLAETMAGDPQP